MVVREIFPAPTLKERQKEREKKDDVIVVIGIIIIIIIIISYQRFPFSWYFSA
jgi:hypothetical protein